MSSDIHKILLELALASHPRSDTSELLTDVLPLFVRRLGCLAGAVLDASQVPARKVASLPRYLPADSGLEAALAGCGQLEGTDFRDERGRVYYLWHLGGDLRLLLLRALPFDEPVLRDLGPVIKQLGHALELTLGRHKLLAANMHSERLTLLLETISGVNRLITREHDRDRLLENVCRLLVSNRGYFNVWVALVAEAESVPSFYRAGFETGGCEENDLFAPMAGLLAERKLPHCAQLALSQSGLHIIHQPTVECGDCPLAKAYTGRIGLTARLEHDGRVYGWLTVSTDAEHARDQRELDLLRQLAEDLAHALHALEIAQQQHRRMETSQSLSELFSSLGTDCRQNIDRIVAQTCNLTKGAASIYNRLDAHEKSLLVWSGHNLPGDMPTRDAPQGHICYEATILGQDQTIAIDDLDLTNYRESDPNVQKYGLKSYLGHPVRLGNRAIGSL